MITLWDLPFLQRRKGDISLSYVLGKQWSLFKGEDVGYRHSPNFFQFLDLLENRHIFEIMVRIKRKTGLREKSNKMTSSLITTKRETISPDPYPRTTRVREIYIRGPGEDQRVLSTVFMCVCMYVLTLIPIILKSPPRLPPSGIYYVQVVWRKR